MKKKPKVVRIKFVRAYGNHEYIVIRDGEVRYMSASETPLALSNLCGANAAELRFALEDCGGDVDLALKAVRKFCKQNGDYKTIEVIP
jgi:hypothetical protein